MSGGAYRAGDLEVGMSQAPMEGSLMELAEMAFILLLLPSPSVSL
jgi:hypothetical protein